MRYQSENFGGDFVFRCKRHFHWEVDMHLHEYSELVYCKNGECTVYVNGATFSLGKGEFIWLPSNYIHMYKSESAEIICAVFSNDYVPLFNKMTGEKKLRVMPLSAVGIEWLLDRLIDFSAKDFLTISGYLTLICARVFENAVLEDSRSVDEILCQKVIFYIQNHFTEDITLSDMARKFGYNEKYLSHSLHAFTGIHFRKLLIMYRINKAKAMLSSKEQASISSIALSCGFSALNSFHRAFKEITGITPSEYKKDYLRSVMHI